MDRKLDLQWLLETMATYLITIINGETLGLHIDRIDFTYFTLIRSSQENDSISRSNVDELSAEMFRNSRQNCILRIECTIFSSG